MIFYPVFDIAGKIAFISIISASLVSENDNIRMVQLYEI